MAHTIRDHEAKHTSKIITKHKETVACEHCKMSFTHKSELYKHRLRNSTCRTQQELKKLKEQVQQLQAQLPTQEIQ